MSRIVLVGGGDKRLRYFQQAAAELDVPFLSCTWAEYPQIRLPGDFVKLDPPPCSPTDIAGFPEYIGSYTGLLQTYGRRKARYLNHPLDILAALDKLETKRRLVEKGIFTPPSLSAHNYPSLLEAMERHKINQVFVKPRFGSGAAGVLAFRRNGAREQLYTSLQLHKGSWRNTKKIHTSSDPSYNRAAMDTVFAMGAVVEQWIPKKSVNGITFDLRAVWQFGKLAAVVARGSRGPITNLHLNNMALDLPFSTVFLRQLDELCCKTMALFPGLHYAGIDLLIPSGGGPPMVLEVNGQGDLIYSDIFHENRIYNEQVRFMKEGCV